LATLVAKPVDQRQMADKGRDAPTGQQRDRSKKKASRACNKVSAAKLKTN
jgi:hypothetical protein